MRPDALTSCPRRESSTHAPQALELLNGDLANRPGGGSRAAVCEPKPAAIRAKQVDLAYRLAAGRAADSRKSCSVARVSEDAVAGASSRWRCST